MVIFKNILALLFWKIGAKRHIMHHVFLFTQSNLVWYKNTAVGHPLRIRLTLTGI